MARWCKEMEEGGEGRGNAIVLFHVEIESAAVADLYCDGFFVQELYFQCSPLGDSGHESADVVVC